MATRLFAIVPLMCLLLSGVRASAHDESRLTGTVVKLEAGTGPVRYFVLTLETRVENRRRSLKIVMTERTPIERAGVKVSLAALKPGVRVIIDVTGDSDEDLEALRIKLVASRAPSK